MNKIRKSIVLASLLPVLGFLLPVSNAGLLKEAGSNQLVRKIQTLDFAARDADGFLQTFPPQFNDKNQPSWEAPVPVAFTCPEGTAENTKSHARTTWLTNPRVEEVQCLGDHYKKHRSFLIGADGNGKLTWQHPLTFTSGEYNINENVIGASRQSVVLSNLSVLSAYSGETLYHAPFTLHGKGNNKRPIPDFTFFGAGIFLPDMKGFLIFEADVTLTKREGGLYFVSPAFGQKALWLPVKTTLLGGHWAVEKMVLSRDKQYVLLAKKLRVRGSNKISLAILDLSKKEIVHEELLTNDGQYPHLIEGENGDFIFAYIDRERDIPFRRLVHYRLTGQGASN